MMTLDPRVPVGSHITCGSEQFIYIVYPTDVSTCGIMQAAAFNMSFVAFQATLTRSRRGYPFEKWPTNK